MKRLKNFIREKKIYCGTEYLEVDIIPRTELVDMGARRRSKKKKVSAPKQKNLNDKNAKRYFIQLANSNFNENDLHITLTYSKEFLPETLEDAEKEVSNYIRRVSYRRKKACLSPLKYLLVTEYSLGSDGKRPVRIHHHIIMNGGLERDIIEGLWCKQKTKDRKKRERIGYANADRLQPDAYGLEALTRYLMKSPNGKKRWSSSQNLIKPLYRANDSRYSRRQIQKIVKNEENNINFWKKQYPNWNLTDYKAEYYDCLGWCVYLKMRKGRT